MYIRASHQLVKLTYKAVCGNSPTIMPGFKLVFPSSKRIPKLSA